MATKAEKASIENPDVGQSLGTVEGIAAVWIEEARQPLNEHDAGPTTSVRWHEPSDRIFHRES